MQLFQSPEAPKAIGPYAQAIRTGHLLYCSGQTPLDPATMQLVTGDIALQTRQAISNVVSVLKAAGLTLDHVVKTTVYLTDIANFDSMNAVYGECFGKHRPARTTIAVKALPYHSLFEIECIAEFENGSI